MVPAWYLTTYLLTYRDRWRFTEDVLLTGKSIHPVRIAAVGDLHIRTHIPEELQEDLVGLNDRVDLIVVAGDITENGRIPEVELAAEMFSAIRVPMVAVLGNHDRRGLRRAVMRRVLGAAGLQLLDGDASVLQLTDGRRVGVAGISGTGGGFYLDETDAVIGGRIRQAIAIKARREAARLEQALEALEADHPDITIALTHFAPTVSTLGEEPPLKHWMLGNSLLGRIIDGHPVDLVVHGHAHIGNEAGATPGETPVRNVALPVTGGIVIFEVGPGQQVRSVGEGRQPTSRSTPPKISGVSMTDLLRTN